MCFYILQVSQPFKDCRGSPGSNKRCKEECFLATLLRVPTKKRDPNPNFLVRISSGGVGSSPEKFEKKKFVFKFRSLL